MGPVKARTRQNGPKDKQPSELAKEMLTLLSIQRQIDELKKRIGELDAFDSEIVSDCMAAQFGQEDGATRLVFKTFNELGEAEYLSVEAREEPHAENWFESPQRNYCNFDELKGAPKHKRK